MQCIKTVCIVCDREREVMSEFDFIPHFVCTPCVVAKKNEGKTIKILDGAPRGYVKGTSTPTKQ